MTQTRRTFLTAAVAGSAVTVLPWRALAGAHLANEFKTPAGTITVHPVSHASVVLETPGGTIYVDPVGDAGMYGDFPAPDLILVTHEHGDHYNAETLTALLGENTTLITNPAVHDMLPEDMKARAQSMGNGDTTKWGEVSIEAIPAYNLTAERVNFHPEGRDNGYVLNFGDYRVYLSGDTEDIPEMRALEGIDLAFVCMNLPFTMDVEQAASAVAEFKPTYVYPYHYRGRDGGTQDPEEFARLVGDAVEVKLHDWYNGTLS